MKTILNLIFIMSWLGCFSQRQYTSQSVFSAGNLYKIAIKESGVYKIDAGFLNTLGIPTGNLQSSAIRLFGNTGKMPEEDNNAYRFDDLQENAIDMIDGGDGIFNGTDFFLFYAAGTDYWEKDSLQKRFRHRKNLYSTEAYYFIQVQNNGKRIPFANNPLAANRNVTTYNERYFFEENTTNLLSSGKEWVGLEFSNLPGRSLSKNYTVDLKKHVVTEPITLISNTWARSGSATKFDVNANNTIVQQLIMPPVSGAILDVFATITQNVSAYLSNQQVQNINFTYTPSAGSAQGWLNWFSLHYRRALDINNQPQLFFRDWNSVGFGNIAAFTIANVSSNVQVWDITDPTYPIKQTGNISGNNFIFNQTTANLKEFVAFNNQFLTPVPKGIVPAQNLHNSTAADFLIITTETLVAQANILANYHNQKDNLEVVVASTNQIYNEFSGGIPDITGIRDFIKMYYDKYKNTNRPLKNVLMLGDASYNYLNTTGGNTNMVPAWESANSNDPLQSYVSDDFFGYLDDHENINSNLINLLDIGIGRVPAKNVTEAKQYIDKVLQYHSFAALGPWRNQISLVADDEDGNLHLNDAEILSGTLNNVAKTFIQDKVYLDAFQQVSGSGGSRYPLVNNTINNKIFNGNLILNYSGHGGYKGLAEESILDINMVNNWKNEFKLPLLITATCDFAPYDNPEQLSIGEEIILKAKTGAIALMTTTRVVFAYSNRIINNNYLQFALQRNSANRYLSLGEANRLTKNYTANTTGDIINNRKFTLLGDPALTLAFPKYFVKTISINNKPYNIAADTVKATGTVNIKGEVLDYNLNSFAGFNGKLAISVYDKKQQILTLGNDPGSVVSSFENSGNILFKGFANINNGKFSVDFIAPKDMQYAIGNGTISYYASNDTADASGADAVIVGGVDSNAVPDRTGPLIKAFMNDAKFVSGSLTNESPVLYVQFADSSGINTSDIGVGHEITAVLDGDTRNTIVLNNFYQADLNNFKKGSLRYQLPKLEVGKHSIVIKCWDVFNNSNQIVLDFWVGEENKFIIDRVLNYPNPFTTTTSFWFEHNRPGEDLQVTVTIFSLSGKLVKRIKETINTPGNRSCSITWDGKDDFGDKLARGIYIYQLNVKNLKDGNITKKEKIVKF